MATPGVVQEVVSVAAQNTAERVDTDCAFPAAAAAIYLQVGRTAVWLGGTNATAAVFGVRGGGRPSACATSSPEPLRGAPAGRCRQERDASSTRLRPRVSDPADR